VAEVAVAEVAVEEAAVVAATVAADIAAAAAHAAVDTAGEGRLEAPGPDSTAQDVHAEAQMAPTVATKAIVGWAMVTVATMDIAATVPIVAQVAIVVHQAMVVASSAPEALLDGAVPATAAVGAGTAHEDRQVGLEEDGHTATVHGDHPDGADLDTTQATARIMLLVGDQAGFRSRFPFLITTTIIMMTIIITIIGSASLAPRMTMPSMPAGYVFRFRSPMVLGALLSRVRMCSAALMNTTAQVSFLTPAAVILAGTSTRRVSGTTTQRAFTTGTTPRAAATSRVRSTSRAYGSMLIHARLTTTTNESTSEKRPSCYNSKFVNRVARWVKVKSGGSSRCAFGK
jgi:hypothetical protein